MRVTLHLLAAVFGSLAILFAVGAWRLSSGPISLAFLAPYVQEGFVERHPGQNLVFDDIVLTWAGWKNALDVLALNLSVIGAEGRLLLSVPEASVVLDAHDLLRGRIAFSRVDLIGPIINLVHGTDGGVYLGIGGEAGGAGFLLEDLLLGARQKEAAAGGPRERGRLQQISLTDAELTIDDQMGERTWRAVGVDANILGAAGGLAGDLALELDLESGEAIPLKADFRYLEADRKLDLDLEIVDLAPRSLVELMPGLSAIAGVEIPVSGRLKTAIDSSFELGPVDFDLGGGPGRIVVPGLYDSGLAVERLQAKGRLGEGGSVVQIDDLYLDFGGAGLALDGRLTRDGEDFAFKGNAILTDVPLDDFGTYWPESVGRPPRRWIRANLSDGIMPRLSVAIDITSDDLAAESLPPKAVQGELDLVGVTVDYLDPLPKMYGANAHATFDAERLDITLDGGRVLDALAVEDGRVTITDLGLDSVAIETALSVRGPIRAQLELLDQPKLGYPSRLGIDPARADGDADTRLDLRFPLLADIPMEEIQVEATSSIQSFALPGVKEGYDLADANLELTLDNSGMDVAGPGTLNGVPLYISWRENFADDAPFVARIELVGTLDDDARAALGVAAAPYLAGTTPYDFLYTDLDRTNRRIELKIDATRARLAVPEILWHKRAGRFGSIELTFDFQPDRPVQVSRMNVRAPGFEIDARALLEPGFGALREARFSTLRFGLSKVSGRLAPNAGGGYDIAVAGDVIDLRPFILSFLDSNAEPTMGPFTLNAQAGRLILGADLRPDERPPIHLRMLTDARATIRYRDDSWREATLDGTLPGGGALNLKLAPEAGGIRRLTLASRDAGAVARVAGVYDNMVGGELNFNAAIQDDEPGRPMRGLIKIKDYRIVKAPALAQMLNIISLFGLLDALQGEGIAFSRFSFPFTLVDDRLTTEDSRASGTSLGINFSGDLDMRSKQVEAKGTLVPAYVINSLLGNIPIIGDIITGGEGEGIIAAKFSMSGRFDDPEVSVNPISMLTPGFLRNLFGDAGGDVRLAGNR